MSPYAFVFAVRDLRSAGRSVGALYAISTVGSIFGTIGTAFYLILWVGTSSSLQLLGSLLIFVAVAALFLDDGDANSETNGCNEPVGTL